jgi:hypothetical protein
MKHIIWKYCSAVEQGVKAFRQSQVSLVTIFYLNAFTMQTKYNLMVGSQLPMDLIFSLWFDTCYDPDQAHLSMRITL